MSDDNDNRDNRDNGNLTVRILVDIREQVQATNVRLDQVERRLDGRIDQLGNGLDGRIDRLDAKVDAGFAALERQITRQIVESETRTATAIHELAGTLHDVRDMLRSTQSRRSS
jgi:hypothetical protein